MNYSTIRIMFSVALMGVAFTAISGQPDLDISSYQFRLLGPAISRHFDASSAPIVTPGQELWNCFDVGTAYLVNGVSWGPSYKCDGVPLNKRGWQEFNAAIGFEFSNPVAGVSDAHNFYFGQIVNDSTNTMGLMLGAGRIWTMSQADSWKFSFGLGGGLWRRGVVFGDRKALGPGVICHSDAQMVQLNLLNREPQCLEVGSLSITATQIDMRTVPFVLPFVEIENRSGLGVRAAIAPHVLDGVAASSTPALMLQLTWQIK